VTETNFFEAARMQRPPGRIWQTPDQVVDVALRALKSRKSSVISGWINVLIAESARVMPRKVLLKIIGEVMRKTAHRRQL